MMISHLRHLNTLDNIVLDEKETLIFPEWKIVENPMSKSIKKTKFPEK